MAVELSVELEAVHSASDVSLVRLDKSKFLLSTASVYDFLSSRQPEGNTLLQLFKNWEADKVDLEVYVDKWPEVSSVIAVRQTQSLPSKKLPIVVDVALLGTVHSQLVQMIDQIDIHKKRCELHHATHIGPIQRDFADKLDQYLSDKYPDISVKISPPLKHYILDELPEQIRVLPKGYCFGQLKPHHSTTIGLLWPENDYEELTDQQSIDWFHDIIEQFPSCAIFQEGLSRSSTGEIASWAVSTYDGMIEHLYTMEEHRGLGLATMVITELSKDTIASGRIPHAMVEVDNVSSSAVFEKVGFSCEQDNYHWLMITF